MNFTDFCLHVEAKNAGGLEGACKETGPTREQVMHQRLKFKVSAVHSRNAQVSDPNSAALLSQRKSKSVFLAKLKECIDCKDLNRGRILHTEAVEGGYDSDNHVSSRLVKMYSKCGSMVEARTVFDNIGNPSVIAWNILIKGYVENGESEPAFRLAAAMESRGLSPNTWTFVALLKACVSAAEKEVSKNVDGKLVKVESLKTSRRFHAQAREIGCDRDMFVANTLMDAYSNCGSMVDCRSVFGSMHVHDVVTWNTLILGYSENGEEETALQLFLRMVHEQDSCRPDARTFVAVLKACTGLVSREKESEVDGRLLKLQSLERGMAVHSEAAERGFCSDIFVASCLIDLYAKCGRMEEARAVFERMDRRNVVTWTALLTGYAENGDSEVVFRLFELMHGECAVNARTLLAALKACGGVAGREEAVSVDGKLVKMSGLERVMAFHAYAQRTGWRSNLLLENSLVDLYAKCGSMTDSKRVFDGMAMHDVVSWNSLLQGFVENGEAELTLEFFTRMATQPDERSFLAVLKACSSLAVKEEAKEFDAGVVKIVALGLGMAVHSWYLQSGFSDSSDTYAANTAMDTYFKCGSTVDARRVFDSMQKRNLISWTIAILGHAEHGEGEAGLDLFLRLRSEKPLARDTGLYIAALKACSSISVLEYGKAIHAELCKYGLDSAGNVGSSLVDFYGKCGAKVNAEQVFESMVRADVVAWTALLTGFSRQGDTDRVFELFDKLRENDVRPVGVTFLAILAACSHAGLVEKGRKCFESMRSEFAVEPEIDHYHCLVDLLGRANRVESALEVMRSMPFRANAVSWTTLLAACRKWNNMEVARDSFQEFLSLDNEQQASAAYVLMRNMSMHQRIPSLC